MIITKVGWSVGKEVQETGDVGKSAGQGHRRGKNDEFRKVER